MEYSAQQASPAGRADVATPKPRFRGRKAARWTILVALIAVAGVLIEGELRFPTGPASGKGCMGTLPNLPAGKNVFRVGTFNMHSGVGEDNVYNLNRTIASVDDTDFCALNEVRGRFSGEPRNQAQELGQDTGHAWLYLPSERRFWHDDFGNGLITRLAISDWVRMPLPTEPSHGGLRNATILRVAFGDRQVWILLTHIDRSKDQAGQIRMVARLFDSLAAPAMLLGDLNANSDNPEVRNLLGRRGVHDCITEGGGQPRNRIDWILAKGLKTVAGGQIANGASDHPMYWVDVSPNP